MADEEVEEEVVAFEAVYADECTIVQRWPPHVTVALKPGTAADISVQFVEAVLVIKANDQYPAVAPAFSLKDTKGLDDRRHAKLLSDLHAEVDKLPPQPLLLVLAEDVICNEGHVMKDRVSEGAGEIPVVQCPVCRCIVHPNDIAYVMLLNLQCFASENKAAKDLLSSMNVPDGDCCFCMLPLAVPDAEPETQPFMKLMSCFHCFHSDCFGRWWRWLHSKPSAEGQEDTVLGTSRVSEGAGEIQVVQCPVCRCVVHPNDIAHVRDYLISSASENKEILDEEPLEMPTALHTDVEIARRANFAAEFEAQKSRGGIIEPKKLEVILPGMVVPSMAVPQSVEVAEVQPPTSVASESASNDAIEVPTHDPTSMSSKGGRHHYQSHRGRVRQFSRRPGAFQGTREHQITSRRAAASTSNHRNPESHQSKIAKNSNPSTEVLTGEASLKLPTRDSVIKEKPISSTLTGRELFEGAAAHGASASSVCASSDRGGKSSIRGSFRGRPGQGMHKGGRFNTTPTVVDSSGGAGGIEGQSLVTKGGIDVEGEP